MHKNAAFFIFIRLCTFVLSYAQQATFFFLDIFYAHFKLSLFLFVFVRFVRVGSFCKILLIPLFTLLLT